ncbi:MAG: ArnT family glycosyltransferase, partial [Planctomycetota bacterium]
MRLGLAFFGILGMAFLHKPLLIPDETRYLAVAWEMWRDGNFLVPKLNGEFYTHKPPFLFWLMHLGWSVFGVNAWWPRLLAPIALLLNALLIKRLGQRMFPERPKVGSTAATLYLGTLFPVLFMTQVMFDLWVVLWVLLGLTALVDAHRGASLPRTSLMAAVALGMGIVTKGPVLLLYLLPPALAAKHWSARPKAVLLTGLCGLLGGAALALAWAIPAGIAGGEAYREAIFWGQTAGRMNNSFAHARPFWWYLQLLPVMLYPWVFWRPTFDGWAAVRKNDGWLLRLTLWTVVPQFLVFSAISGKQPHYLLPLFPILALALGRRLDSKPEESSSTTEQQAGIPWTLLLPVALGLALLTSGFWFAEDKRPDWFSPMRVFWPAGMLLLFPWLLWNQIRKEPFHHEHIAVIAPSMVMFVLFILGSDFHKAYDIRPVCEIAATHEAEGKAMAFYGSDYAGQFHFYGRLHTQLGNPHNERELKAWLRANPEGILFQIVRHGQEDKPYGFSPRNFWPHEFGSRRIQVWDAAAL